jgi:hypothetical protein
MTIKFCDCGCGIELKPDQVRWANGNACKNKFNNMARHKGQELLTRKTNFHFANAERSDVLQKTLAFLRQGPRTTIEITHHTGTTRASSDISELRANGYMIDCEYVGLSDNGKKIHRYILREERAA